MNVIKHIEEMRYDGWCEGCSGNSDDCMKMYKLYGYLPDCLGD